VSGSTGPRAAGHETAYEQLLGDIEEGVRLHYGQTEEDADLALLTGDMLYARGLSTLAELGDIEATAELADVISLIAQAHLAGDSELARAVWEAGTVAVYWGTNQRYDQAKELARTHAPGAARALRQAADALQSGSDGGAARPGAAPSRTR
jgi:hypothetical protein